MEDNHPLPAIITPQLIEYIRQNYQLNWNGIHGWAHWVRVCENGLHLARKNGADQDIVALFAFTHDMARRNDGWDINHGGRAAAIIKKELQGRFFNLSPSDLKLLTTAVKLHTAGLVRADLTVQTCWDSDRLDLGRVGYRPDPRRLCTAEAKDPATIEWAFRRSAE